MDLAPERELVEYLLGRLPEPERVQLEERLFEDADLDEQLVATTDDLIHAYLRGELVPADRKQFEIHFLAAADHRQRLRFMTNLLATVDAPARQRSSHRGHWWLAAAVVLIVIGAIVVSVRHRDARDRDVATSSPPASDSVRPTPSQPSTPQGDDVLLVRVPRSSAPVTVRVSEQTRVVRLQVKVDDTSPSFDATIHAADGGEIWRANAMTPPVGGLLVLEVPAKLLRVPAHAAYALRIMGESLRADAPSVLEYRLQVEREDARAARR